VVGRCKELTREATGGALEGDDEAAWDEAVARVGAAL
jgi:hypothetical protein